MEFVYSSDSANVITEHEKMMLNEYSNIISEYSDMFAQYDCTLDVGCYWTNPLKNIKSFSEISFRNGYRCYIYCNVMKDGEILRYKSDNDDADYFEASVSWNISAVNRSFFHLTVTLNHEMDIHNEIKQLLKVTESL